MVTAREYEARLDELAAEAQEAAGKYGADSEQARDASRAWADYADETEVEIEIEPEAETG